MARTRRPSQQIEGIRRAALTCKSPYRHSWDTPGPNPERRGGRRKSFGTLITFRCIHCGSYRYWVLSRLTGELLSSWYEPSSQYRQVLDLKMSANEWRAAWMDAIDNKLMEDLEKQNDELAERRKKRAG